LLIIGAGLAHDACQGRGPLSAGARGGDSSISIVIEKYRPAVGGTQWYPPHVMAQAM
jgi:hypothetical protein